MAAAGGAAAPVASVRAALCTSGEPWCAGGVQEVTAHVLVVDDEPELLHVLADYLRRIGFFVTATTDPEAALHAANADPVDVVLTDLCLGPCSGMDLTERLWTLHPEVPVVLMSGATSELATVPGLAFVPKPFGLTEIAGVLRRTLRDRRELVGQ
jgi:DNA-binding response OmpR family regulator